MAVVLVAVVAAAVGLRQLARSRTIQLFGQLVPRIETSERVVALTFDDGPASEWLDEIVGALGHAPCPRDILRDGQRAGRRARRGTTARRRRT